MPQPRRWPPYLASRLRWRCLLDVPQRSQAGEGHGSTELPGHFKAIFKYTIDIIFCSLKENLPYHINVIYVTIYMAQPWAAPPPPPGMVMVPCPAPCGSGWSGWGGCGWVGMLVDGVEVFANDVESYSCKELYLVRERRQTWKAHSLMMGL